MRLLVLFCCLLTPLYATQSFVVTHVKTDARIIAITFDDGPTTEYGTKILNILDFFESKGTFFYVGKRLRDHPEIAIKTRDKGHEIGNHSYSHEDYSQMKSKSIKKDIGASQGVFREKLGFYPSLFRPPYGSFKGSQIRHMKPYFRHLIKWSIDPRDWDQGMDKAQIKAHILSEARPGAIILLHENEKTLRMLPFLLLELEKKGYTFVTVSELISKAKN